MTTKYLKLEKGLSFFAVGILLQSIGNALYWVYNFATVMWEQTFALNTIGSLFGWAGEILVPIGLIIAAKERKKYYVAFFLFLGRLVVSFWHGVFLGLNVPFFANYIGIVSKVVTFTFICMVCLETVKFLKEEGQTLLTKWTVPAYVGCGIFYGYSVVMLILSMFMNTNQTIFGILGLVANVGSVVGRIAYILFFFLTVNYIKKEKLQSE